MARKIDTARLARPAAVMLAMATPMQPALATDFRLHCTPTTPDALALCDAFAVAWAESQWANIGNITVQLDINNLRPTAINVTMNLTNARGDAHTINRGLSARDTTITPTMQAAFLKKLLAAIPPDF